MVFPFAERSFDIVVGPSNVNVHIYITRISMKEVPRGEEEMGKWLYGLYEKKDKLMAHWKQHGTFPGGELSMPFDHRKCEEAFYTWTPLMLATLLGCIFGWRALRRVI